MRFCCYKINSPGTGCFRTCNVIEFGFLNLLQLLSNIHKFYVYIFVLYVYNICIFIYVKDAIKMLWNAIQCYRVLFNVTLPGTPKDGTQKRQVSRS